MPVDIDQGPARVAGVDGGIGLNEVFKGIDAQVAAPQSTDDAAGDGLAHTKWIANGQHLVAHGDVVRVAQGHHGQLLQGDFQHGQVGFGVGANDGGAGAAAIGEADFDLVGPFHHVVVGQDVAIAADDDSAAQPRFLLGADITKKELKPRVIRPGVAHRLAGGDAHHRWHGRLGGVA